MELAKRMMALRIDRKLSWAKTGELMGISGALAWKVAHGKCDSVKAREHFGLPQKTISVLPCSCGAVHALKNCPKKRKHKKLYTVAFKFEDEDDAIDFRNLIGSDRIGWVKKQIEAQP